MNQSGNTKMKALAESISEISQVKYSTESDHVINVS